MPMPDGDPRRYGMGRGWGAAILVLIIILIIIGWGWGWGGWGGRDHGAGAPPHVTGPARGAANTSAPGTPAAPANAPAH